MVVGLLKAYSEIINKRIAVRASSHAVLDQGVGRYKLWRQSPTSYNK